MTELITLDKPEPGIGVLTLNRPEKLNALSGAMLDAFQSALDKVERDPEIRVLVLTGAGDKAFAAGADIAGYKGRREREFMDFQFAGRRLNDRIDPMARVFYAAPFVDMHNRMKEALVLLGKLPRAVVRPPLVKIGQAEIEGIRQALLEAGLLSQTAGRNAA